MISTQMLKGILEGCILAAINHSELYGYEISERLSDYGFGKIAGGTIYPLLLRLEKNGLLAAVFRDSEVGPIRKYYSLTKAGILELQQFKENFNELNSAVNKLLNDTKEV